MPSQRRVGHTRCIRHLLVNPRRSSLSPCPCRTSLAGPWQVTVADGNFRQVRPLMNTLQARARRYALGLTVQYREKGHTEWHMGTTHNISESGMLFSTGCVPSENAMMEMRIQLSMSSAAEPAAEVVCQGAVVRRMLPLRLGVMPAAAVQFVDYRFVRGAVEELRTTRQKSARSGHYPRVRA